MPGSTLDHARREPGRVMLSGRRGKRPSVARQATVAAAALLSILAVLTLLSALTGRPAAPSRPEQRTIVFTEIAGALLERYANEDRTDFSDRGAEGQAAPGPSALIEAISLPSPSTMGPVPDFPAAAPSTPVPSGTVDARTMIGVDEGEARSDPSARSPSTDSLAILSGRTVAPGLRIFVHFSAQAPSGRQRAIAVAQELEDQGFTVADIREVAFAIASPKVRYFFPTDRSGAERLARKARAVLMSGDERRPIPVQDYTHFRPLPTPGNVEIWLESRRPGEG